MIRKHPYFGTLQRVHFVVGWDDEIRQLKYFKKTGEPALFGSLKSFDTKEEAEEYRKDTVLSISEVALPFKFCF